MHLINVFAFTSSLLVLFGSQVTALKINEQDPNDSPYYHAEPEMISAEELNCTCRNTLFFDLGPGATGGESLNMFFKQNHFRTIFWVDPHGIGLSYIVKDDLDHGRYDLPKLKELIATAAIGGCGNVYVGDVKLAYSSPPPYTQMFQSLDQAFPHATWIWAIRHPDAWATSATHFIHVNTQEEADRLLQRARAQFNSYHCGIMRQFGERTIGNPSNAKGNVVQLNLERLDWPLFTKQLQDASGNQCLEPGESMPHVGHHPASWVYEVEDQKNWDAWAYLAKHCQEIDFALHDVMVDTTRLFEE